MTLAIMPRMMLVILKISTVIRPSFSFSLSPSVQQLPQQIQNWQNYSNTTTKTNFGSVYRRRANHELKHCRDVYVRVWCVTTLVCAASSWMRFFFPVDVFSFSAIFCSRERNMLLLQYSTCTNRASHQNDIGIFDIGCRRTCRAWNGQGSREELF